MLLVVAAIGMMYSCSSDKQDGLAGKIKDVVSDNTDVVITGDIARLFEQLEFTVKDGKIDLPPYFTRMLNNAMNSKERIELTSMLDKVEGIDYNNALIALNIKGMNPQVLMVFSVTDEDVFAKSMQSLDESVEVGKAGSFKTVGNDQLQIFVDGKMAYIPVGAMGPATGDGGAKAIEKWQDAASDKPVADWKKDFLLRPNVMNLLMSAQPFYQAMQLVSNVDGTANLKKLGMEELKDGYIGMTANLEGPSFEMTGESFNKDGKNIESNYGGKFNQNLMDYAAHTDLVAFSLCMNENGYNVFAEAFKQAAAVQPAGLADQVKAVAEMAGLPAEYLSDGGMFAAGGLAPSVTMSNFNPNSPASYHVVIAADIKADKVAEAFDGVCSALDAMAGKSGVKSDDGYTVTVKANVGYNDFTEQIEYVEVPVYVKVDDNILVISNSPIVKAQYIPFDKTLFASGQSTIQIITTGNTPVVKELNLPVGLNMYATAQGSGGKFMTTFTDTDKKFVPALVDLLGSFN